MALVEDSLYLHLLSLWFGSDKFANSSLPKLGSRCTPRFYFFPLIVKKPVIENSSNSPQGFPGAVWAGGGLVWETGGM